MKDTTQDSFSHLMGLAQRSHQKDDLTMAANLYKEALKVIPRQPDALQLLGIVYCSQQQYTQGIGYLEKALDILPDNPVFLTNLSNAYLKMEAYTKALPLLEKSVRLKPDFDEAWHKLGNTLKSLNRIEEAVQAYNKTLELNPRHYNAFYNLGNTMLLLGNYKSAIAYYEKSISINPGFAPAHNNLGIALLEWDRIDEAEVHYLKAVQLQPDYKEAIKNLTQLYGKSGKDEQTKRWGKELLRLYPDNNYIRFELETKAPIIPVSNDDIDAYRNYLSTVLEKSSDRNFSSVKELLENSCYPSSELIYQGRTDKKIKEKYARLFHRIPTCTVSHKNAKPHAGFVVTGGHEGVFLKCMRGILNTIDTEKIDISVVCSLPNGEKIIAPALTNKSVRFVNLPAVFSDAQEILIQEKFDILYYWEIGTDAVNYFLALTKPARVQVASWGWPTTSGLNIVDYFISQKELEPANAQQLYTEKLILFNKLPVYYYRPRVPANCKPLSAYNIPLGKRTYICQQNARKVHPDFDNLIAQLLQYDKEGIVLFIKDKQEAITNKLKQRMQSVIGNDFSRILFLERMPEEEYLGVLSQCSVVLDTLHYGGGANTIYDAIQAAIPVITLEGNRHSARFASAALKQLGVVDTIVQSPEEYVKKAIDIASDESLRTGIIQRMKQNASRIFEDLEAVKELENFLLNLPMY